MINWSDRNVSVPDTIKSFVDDLDRYHEFARSIPIIRNTDLFI
jgi:hypothetical protein